MNKLKNYKNKKLNQTGFGAVEVLLIIIALTLIVGVGFYVFRSNDDKNSINQSSSQTTADKKEVVSTDTKSVDTTQQVKELIEYTEKITIDQKSDVTKLTDASQSFKDYIASLVQDKPVYVSGCNYPKHITVEKIYKDQFALGSEGVCTSGYQIWKKTDNKWALTIGGQTLPVCSDIKKYSIPHQIYDKCADETKNYEIISNTL